MERFREALQKCDLHDLGFVGDPFTWRNNHRNAMTYTKLRLDRIVANSAWRNKFPLVRVINGDPRHSDHCPIIVDPGDTERIRWMKPLETMRKFEARWLEEFDCGARVSEAWEKALHAGEVSLLEIQRNVLKKLLEWDWEVLGSLKKRIKNAQRELERCHRQPITQEQVD